MAFEVIQDGQRLKILFSGPWKGLHSNAPPNLVPPEYLADLGNVDMPAGSPVRQDGTTLHATGMVLPGADEGTLLARYNPTTGTALYLVAGKDGHVYQFTGGAFTSLRRGLSTTDWWSHTQIGDYLVISNPTDGPYKWDRTRLLPVGAKYAADMESDETTWTGGTVETTLVKEGTQARLLTASAGGTASMYLQPATARDLVSGLFSATNYNTTDDRISFWVNLSVAANLDTALSYIRFGNVAGTAYFQALASTWGTLVNGWNLVRIARSAFTTTGAPNWNSIAKITYFVDAVAGQNVTAVFDDTYVIYAASRIFPSVQIVSNWKNMLLGARTTSEPSTFFFSKVSAPDEYSALANFPVNEKDGDAITGLHPYYNQVFVGKDNTCHSISGTVAGTIYPNYNLENILVSVEHGVSSHRAMVEAGGTIYFPWRNEYHKYRGTGTEKVSYNIDPTLATVEAAGRLQYIVGARRRPLNQIHWYFSQGSDTQNARCVKYDYIQDLWLRGTDQTMALIEQVFEGNIEYLLTVGYAGRVLRQDSGTDFDGVAITSFITLPWTSGHRPFEAKAWEEVHVNYQTNTGNLVVKYRVAAHPREFDAASYVTAGTLAMNATGELGRSFIGERSRWIQIRLETVGAAWTQYSPIVITGVPLGAEF